MYQSVHLAGACIVRVCISTSQLYSILPPPIGQCHGPEIYDKFVTFVMFFQYRPTHIYAICGVHGGFVELLEAQPYESMGSFNWDNFFVFLLPSFSTAARYFLWCSVAWTSSHKRQYCIDPLFTHVQLLSLCADPILSLFNPLVLYVNP